MNGMVIEPVAIDESNRHADEFPEVNMVVFPQSDGHWSSILPRTYLVLTPKALVMSKIHHSGRMRGAL